MTVKRLTAALAAATFLLVLAAGAAHAQEKVLWTRTKLKVKGEAYSDTPVTHEGRKSVALTCYHRTTFDGPDDDQPAVRQYCPQADGEFESDDPTLTFLPLPGDHFLAGGDLEASDGETRVLEMKGFYRFMVRRKGNGTPKAVSIRQRNAVGEAEKAGARNLEIVGGGAVSGKPVAVSQLPDLLQQVSAQRPKLMVCGSSSRDVGSFIPGGVELAVVSSCTPDSDTQALIVTRYGTASLIGVVVEAYVTTGGIVITEYDNADDVFNLVFPETVTQAEPQYGSVCRDNVQPQVQYKKKDPFWSFFDFESVGLDPGCGFSLADFPGITKLGGWSEAEGSVSLAYRRLGDGRVWFVSADWQDTSELFTETSRRMLGHMIMHR
jgi:hypothetical protein